MAVTHFKILELLDANHIIAKNGVSALNANVLYPIADQANLNFQRVAGLENFYVSGKMKFQAYDQTNDVYGNEAIATIQWKAPDALRPQSANASITLLNDDSRYLLNVLPLNGAVEFIKVYSGSNIVGTLQLDGVDIGYGDVIKTADLLRAIYTVGSSGWGNPYATFSYSVGKNGQEEPERYDLTIVVEDPTPVANLSVTPTSKTVVGEGASFVVNVTVDAGQAWAASEAADWLSLDTVSGTGPGSFTVLVDPNMTGVERYASISVSAGGNNKSVGVTQQIKTT